MMGATYVKNLSRYALSWCIASALLASCGGTQPPIGGLGAISYTSVVATRPQFARSRILPNATRDDLLYVSNTWYSHTGVTIYDLRSTKLVGTITGLALPAGLCSDSSGNVYVADEGRGQIFEYAHGGTEPIKMLNDPSGYPVACSFDNTTGNLEVTDGESGVLIYEAASGTPTWYYNYRFGSYNFAAYDNRGNLVVDGEGESGPQFAELPKGGGTLINIKLNAQVVSPEGVSWDGKYFAICDLGQRPNAIDAFSVSGSTGTLERTVALDDSVTLLGLTISSFGYSRHAPRRKEVIAADMNDGFRKGYVWYWNYPKGGMPIEKITQGVREPVGVAVSEGRELSIGAERP
jgi:hypothetical protein